MSLLYFDLVREFFESQYIGGTALAVLIAIIIVIIFLLLMNAGKDAIFLIPLPIFISLGLIADAEWLSVIAYILAGVYFANVVLALFNRDKA